MSKDKKRALINLKASYKSTEKHIRRMTAEIKFMKEMIEILEKDGK